MLFTTNAKHLQVCIIQKPQAAVKRLKELLETCRHVLFSHKMIT